MYKVIGWNILVKYEIFFNEGYKDICNDVFLLNCLIGLVFFLKGRIFMLINI